MPQRLCDSIYDMVISAKLTNSQSEEVYFGISRRIAKVSDGHVVRRVINKYALQPYYDGDGNLQEKVLYNFTLWRPIWHIIYNNGYTDKFMKKTCKIFSVDLSDVEFVIQHLYQADFNLIQIMNYDPLTDYGKYNAEKLVRNLIKPINYLVNGLAYIYNNDPGTDRNHFVDGCKLKALEGFRRYEGECIDEADLQNKMYSTVNSWVKDIQNSSDDFKRIVETKDGFDRRVLYLDTPISNNKGSTSKDTMKDMIVSTEMEEHVHFKEYLEDVQKYCSEGVFLYVKAVIEGNKLVDSNDEKYYSSLRKIFSVTLEQVKDEVAYVLNMRQLSHK